MGSAEVTGGLQPLGVNVYGDDSGATGYDGGQYGAQSHRPGAKYGNRGPGLGFKGVYDAACSCLDTAAQGT